MSVCLGVIGGSGLYDIDGVEILGEERVDTPFGEPSAPLTRARANGDALRLHSAHWVPADGRVSSP